MRGEFIRHDGLVIPNNVSIEGARSVLGAAFQDDAFAVYAALVQGTPSLSMTSADFNEPTIGVNGYARILLAKNDTDWPMIGVSNNEAYVESKWLTWAAVGGNFDQPVQRVALLFGELYMAGADVLSVSSLFPTELTVTPTTVLGDRQFKYRFYL